jgi:hypothetical protein
MNWRDAVLPGYMGAVTAVGLRETLDVGAGIGTFECRTEDELLSVAREFGEIMPHRDSDSRGVTSIQLTPGRDPLRDIGLTRAALPLHTDRPAIERPPRVLLLWCNEAEGKGGATLVAHGAEAAAQLERLDPSALKAFTAPEAAIFRTGDLQHVGPVFRMGRPGNDRHQTKRNEQAFRQLGAVLIEGRGAYAVRGRIRPACQRLGYEAMLPLALDVPERLTRERRGTA